MATYEAGEAAPLDIPGLPTVARSGPGSAAGWQYTQALGEVIAEQYVECDGGGLWELRALNPDRIPPPTVIRAWCKHYPAFGLLMAAAEKARAERLMEQTIVIADTGKANAAKLALQISTRQHMASQLDRERFGKGSPQQGTPQLGNDPQPIAPALSDDQLASIASGGSNGG